MAKDWYWDQYDLTKSGSELDITNDEFLQQQDMTRDERNKLETKFIDELYGTDQAQWVYPDPAYAGQERPGLPQPGDRGPEGTGVLGYQGKGGWQNYFKNEGVATWGLDLVRVGGENLEVGTTEHYEWLTRGEVDWAHYQTDNAFKKAFNDMKGDSEAWDTYGNPSDIGFLTDDEWTDQQKVSFIRDAMDFSATKSEAGEPWNDPDNKWYIPDDFDNKYTSKYHHEGENKGQPKDPEAVQPYEASPLFDPSSDLIQSKLVGADGNRMTIRKDISTPSDYGGPRDVAGTASKAGITLKKVNPKRPSNIPAQWGKVGGKK